MTGVQVRRDNTNKPFILDSGLSISKTDGIIFTDAGRAADLVFGTVLAKILATGKLVPFTDETAVDGTAQPIGIYVGADIPFADIVAGDVADVPYIKGGSVLVDESRVVIENAKTKATIIATGTVNAQSVEQVLNKLGIFLGTTEDITEFEN